MILLSSSGIICFYLVAFIIFLLVIGFIKRKRSRFSHPSFFQLLICEFCGSSYIDSHIKMVTRCPECKSLNKNNRYKRD